MDAIISCIILTSPDWKVPECGAVYVLTALVAKFKHYTVT